MTEAARNIHGKSPDNRFALARPLCQRGLKGDLRNHNPVIPATAGIQHLHVGHWIPAFAGMTMLFHDAFPRIMTRESAQP